MKNTDYAVQFVAFWGSLVSIGFSISWRDWSLKMSPNGSINILSKQTAPEFDPPKKDELNKVLKSN